MNSFVAPHDAHIVHDNVQHGEAAHQLVYGAGIRYVEDPCSIEASTLSSPAKPICQDIGSGAGKRFCYGATDTLVPLVTSTRSPANRS